MYSFSRFYNLSMTTVPVPMEVETLLQEEGCPFCMHTSATGYSPCIVLSCTDKGCRHVCHVECIALPFWANRLAHEHPTLSLCARPTLAIVSNPTPAPTSAHAGLCYFDLSFLHLVSSAKVMFLQAYRAQTIVSNDASAWIPASVDSPSAMSSTVSNSSCS